MRPALPLAAALLLLSLATPIYAQEPPDALGASIAAEDEARRALNRQGMTLLMGWALTNMAVGGAASVAPSVTITGMLDLANRAEKSAGTDAERALLLVEETLHRINDANNLLGKEPYALAVNNVLAGFSDKHLEALYLLKQRAGR